MSCRLSWLKLKLKPDYHIKLFKAATGIDMILDDLHKVADRIHTLIKTF